MGPVIVRSSGTFRNDIEVGSGKYQLIADEPPDAGGTDAGPTPYDFLSAALGSCTSMTLQFIAKRDGIPLTGVEVQVSNDRMYAKDCADCMSTSGYIHRFEVKIQLHGDLSDEQREKLLEVARRCPVFKTLTSEIKIHEVLA